MGGLEGSENPSFLVNGLERSTMASWRCRGGCVRECAGASRHLPHGASCLHQQQCNHEQEDEDEQEEYEPEQNISKKRAQARAQYKQQKRRVSPLSQPAC